jgi:hypothetical protein
LLDAKKRGAGGRPLAHRKGAGYGPKKAGLPSWDGDRGRTGTGSTHAVSRSKASAQGCPEHNCNAMSQPHLPTATHPRWASRCHAARIRSTAAAIRNNLRSRPLRAISINPTGSPPARGQGSDMAQRSRRLAITVLRIRIASVASSASTSESSVMVGATIGIVGNTSPCKAGTRANRGVQSGAGGQLRSDCL